MTHPIPFQPGQYRYLPGGFQYSAAVQAMPGHRLERIAFHTPRPMRDGFDYIEAHLARRGRQTTALCAIEMRSPAPMTEPEFIAFNRQYVMTLERWGLYQNEINPVARCNLIPLVGAPTEPSIQAFTYTVPGTDGVVPEFITSGAAECPDKPNYRERIVRLGETSPDALREKLQFAMGDLESRLAALGVHWSDVSKTRLYTVHDLHPLIATEFAHRDALRDGLGWHLVRPPVKDIEIEIDARRISTEFMHF
jgi:hypothetical protein